jgi:VWA domain-containing protein
MRIVSRVALVSSPLCVAILLVGALAFPVRAADPLRVVLLVDSSTNMSTMLTEFRAGLTAFIEAVPDDVEIAFISTGGQLRVRVPPTTDKQRLLEAAGRFASDGGANSFLDTLLESDKRFLKSAPNRRPLFVVMTTDQPVLGEQPINRYNDFMRDFVRRRGRAHGVVIRTTRMGIASEILENMTTNTDGLYDVLAVGNSLPTRMKAIAAEVAAEQ